MLLNPSSCRCACFSALSETQPCLPAGGGRLEVCGDGHRQDLPLGFCDGVRTRNTGTLPAAAHRLHEIKKPCLAPVLQFPDRDVSLFFEQVPSCGSHTSNTALSSPSLSKLTVSSLCLLVFGTPSSSITSSLQLSLPSLDLAWFARVALPCHCARNPFFSFLVQICVYDIVITSALLFLSTFLPCTEP